MGTAQLADAFHQLLPGLGVTLSVFGGATFVALCTAFCAGLARVSNLTMVSWLARVYVAFFRGTSALVQLFWVYFALPLLGLRVDAMAAGIIVLGMNTGAYGAEVVRGAIVAVPKQQTEAAELLGFTPYQVLLRIVLPQALVSMLPPLGNLLIELLKGTALVSLITLSDLTFQGRILRDQTLRTPEVFSLVLAVYFAIAMLLTLLMRKLEKRLGGFMGSHARPGF